MRRLAGGTSSQRNVQAVAVSALVFLGCADTQEPRIPNGVAGSPVLAPGAGGGGGGGTGLPPAAGSTAPLPAGGVLPCNVNRAVVANCQNCHSATPRFGAPMPLVTHADFTRDYTAVTTMQLRGQTMKMHELARIRLNRQMNTAPMPPGGQMTPADHSMLDGWLAAGATAGTTADANCSTGEPVGGGAGGVAAPGGGSGGTGAGGTPVGTGGTIAPPPGSECDPGSYEPIQQMPGETCYELLTHGGQTPGDTSKYTIFPGENYEEFYYKVPWPSGVQATRFGARFDNLKVLHHWLLFSSSMSASADGTHQTVLGTQLLDGNAQLLAGWAVGGCNVEFPPEMGLELPPSGMLNVQWHYFNNGGAPEEDGSGVQVCTVPPGTRPNTGSLTWLGTEDFYGLVGMPPGQNDFGGRCPNDSDGPITIWGFWPHMHELGINMKSTIYRANGAVEEVFNRPFDFNYQVHYENKPSVVLQPGDEIESICTFNNTTDFNVIFGPSTTQEMCYQFAFSYPARALDNGVDSLIGATNTCW